MVIALIVTPDGFPLAYEVMPGNTSDNTTLAGFVEKIEKQYGRSDRVWIMDRGIPTEATLATMREGDAPVHYLVGTPKGRLTKLEKSFLGQPWQAVRPCVEVKLLAGEPSRGAQELVDGAGGGEFVEPTEGSDDGLLDVFSFAAVFRDLKILIRADFLDADEHEASPVLTPHILRRLSGIFRCIGEYLLEFRARIYHYISEQHRPDRLISS